MDWILIIGAIVGFIVGMLITKSWLWALAFALIGFLIALGVVGINFNLSPLGRLLL